MTFHVGQKVVCVDGHFKWLGDFETAPAKGAVYTIREIVSEGSGYLVLEEIRNPPIYGGEDAAFNAAKFRPVEYKSAQLFRDIAAGVTNGSPIIDDPQFDDALPTEALCRFMHSFGGRPML